MKNNQYKKILFWLISLLFIFLSFAKSDIANLNSRLISVNQYSFNAYEHSLSDIKIDSKQRLALKRSITIQKESINKLQQVMIFISVFSLSFIVAMFFIKEIHITYKLIISAIIIYFIIFYDFGYRI